MKKVFVFLSLLHPPLADKSGGIPEPYWLSIPVCGYKVCIVWGGRWLQTGNPDTGVQHLCVGPGLVPLAGHGVGVVERTIWSHEHTGRSTVVPESYCYLGQTGFRLRT